MDCEVFLCGKESRDCSFRWHNGDVFDLVEAERLEAGARRKSCASKHLTQHCN